MKNLLLILLIISFASCTQEYKDVLKERERNQIAEDIKRENREIAVAKARSIVLPQEYIGTVGENTNIYKICLDGDTMVIAVQYRGGVSILKK